MASFSRTQEFSAFQFNLRDGGSDVEVFFQRELIASEMPDLSVYDLDASHHYAGADYELLECRLTIVQHRMDAFGERSNLVHVLRAGNWLVEDHTAEGGYRVMTQEEFSAITGLQSIISVA